MYPKTRRFVFHRIYEMAATVEGGITYSDSFGEIAWEDSDVLKCLVEFSKSSILHHYIYAMVAGSDRFEYTDNADVYDEREMAEIEKMFELYGIEYRPREAFDPERPLSENDSDDPFCRWFYYQNQSFEILWEKITDEVFHLIFANRAFLLQFNLALANYLKSGKVCVPAEYLDAKGVIKRQSYIPGWVKRAVFYRDQGRCVLCQTDLTGLLSTDQVIHYDHIVPLNLWGINDPCNIQLLCASCNLKKSGTHATSEFRYPPWWDY